MKKIILIFTLVFGLVFGADKIIKAGATPTPHAEILQFTKGVLKKQGWDLQVKEFNDSVLIDIATNDGELDANLCQHEQFMNDFNKNKNANLVSLGKIELVPMAIYSNKIKNLKDVPNGAKVGIPNDSTNESRALDLLAKAGLIAFKDSKNTLKTPLDIAQNPKNLKFLEIKSAQLPRSLGDLDLAVIITNYALGAGLNPKIDGLIMEDDNNPYAAMILAVKKGNENNEKVQVLLKALKSKEVKDFMEKKWQGAVLPAS